MTPGTREANNGNWRTAQRWAQLLGHVARPIVQSAWAGEPTDILFALHAHRSATSIAAARAANPTLPIIVVLSGTDLYRDLAESKAAQRSLDIADRIIALQFDARRRLPPQWAEKCVVVYQSAPALPPVRKADGRLDVVVVGHLREEKDPRTLFRAIDRLDPGLPLRVRHIGAALDPALEAEARATVARDPRYRWVGARPHGLTRIAIQRAHLLVHPSIMEGGANVIVEAITAGTPVLASFMSGNLGMLGSEYPGYFPVGDASALAERLDALARDPTGLAPLRRACKSIAHLFTPQRERSALRRLVIELHRRTSA